MASRRAEGKFYEAYGRALAKWADPEFCLAHLFGKVTDMHETVATRVFFSARASSGRLEMLSEALPAQAGHPDTVAAIKALIKKAGQYNATRNRLAHEFTTLRTDYEQMEAEHVLVKTPRLVDITTRSQSLSNAISTKNLKEIWDNFSKLTEMTVLIYASFEHPERHPEHRDTILAMPNLPYTPDQPTHAGAQKRRRRASRP
jgi:hypothetical protein